MGAGGRRLETAVKHSWRQTDRVPGGRRSRLLPLCLTALCLACGARYAAPPGRPSVARLPDSVHWARNSAEHRAAFLQTYRLAARQLERLAAGRAPGSWAVITDADETVLDNSQYQKELAEAGQAFSQESWGSWVRRRRAPPLPGSVAFLRRVAELGGKIAVVTNRTESLCPDTEADFRAFSIPYDVILCRPDEGPGEKEPRSRSVEDGTAHPELPPLEVLMWLGDNMHDFPGQGQARPGEPERPLESFGGRFILFPNPMYGSWLRNPRQ